MMNKLSKLTAIAGLTIAGAWLKSTPVLALNFSLESQIGNDYTYTITLDSDDSLLVGDQLILTNLSGVTAASANNPYTLDGFDTTSANFSVNTLTNGADTLTGVISLTSPDSLSDLEYQIFYSDNGTPRVFDNGSVTPVPFEPEANLAILILLSIFGLKHYYQKAKKSASVANNRIDSKIL